MNRYLHIKVKKIKNAPFQLMANNVYSKRRRRREAFDLQLLNVAYTIEEQYWSHSLLLCHWAGTLSGPNSDKPNDNVLNY